MKNRVFLIIIILVLPRTGVSRRHWMIYAIQDLTTSNTSQSPQSDALSSMIKQKNVSQSVLHISFYTQASII